MIKIKPLYSGWTDAVSGRDDTYEINDSFEIEDYQDISHFFDELFGEHDIFPEITATLSVEERKIDLESIERKIILRSYG